MIEMTNRRIVVVYSNLDGGSNEDCNIFYCNYLLVESDTLDLSEIDEDEVQADDTQDIINDLTKRGYTVTDLSETTKCFPVNDL